MAKRTDAERKARRAAEDVALRELGPIFTPELDELVKGLAQDFSGQLPDLRNAVGALVMGRVYGWKVLRLVHDGPTYSRYERRLGLKFREVCPELGPLARRSLGLEYAEKVQAFWKVAKGELAVPGEGRQKFGEVDNPIPDPLG